MDLNRIRQTVREVCDGKENRLTSAFFDEHVCVVAKYALMLAGPLHADLELVEIAAYLHDISAVRDFSTLPTHASQSASQAAEMLEQCNCAQDRIAIVRNAIELHSQPLQSGAPEAVCLSNADALAQIANPAYWLFFAFRIMNMDFAAGRQWYRNRVNQNWNAMIPEARAMAEREYAAALSCLENK